jgi:pimeloyl-ACP methyl ester carboxylesterase
VLSIPAVAGTAHSTQTVGLAFRDRAAAGDATSGDAASPTALPIVLLHGSPGSGDVFDRLLPSLGHRRVIAPDLPGFGASSHEIPDYSFLAHAIYVDALLDRLGIARAHVLGFSMGGGVALSLADRDPGRVASLTLLSAIGVQEMELLGEYHINHLIHGAQLLGLWTLSQLVPHTGWLDSPRPYARNFYDSDQRPLRAALARLQPPVLILHGRNDPLVPLEAAVEHARLAPQAELHVFAENHFMLFEDTGELTPVLVEFIDRVDRGQAATRGAAAPARITASREPFDPSIVARAQAVTAGVLAAATAVGAWAFSGLAPVGAGVLLAQGRTSATLALLFSLIGVLAARMRRRTWAAAATQVGLTTLRVAAGAGAGALTLRAFPFGAGAWTRATAITVATALALRLVGALATHRHRRLLLSSWRRLTRWEFWPHWIVYPPVVIWIAWLAIKHRSATVFTACNPAMPASGFIGESKSDILRGLGNTSGRVASSALIDRGLSAVEKLAAAERFLSSQDLSLPVVLKPNEGQRGSGVMVARTTQDLADYLNASRVDTVIQTYVPGVEFGVFYCRRPSESRGWIFSITEKHLPAVRGDGRRTLEALILDDDRAVCMAQFHLQRQHRRLAEVPARETTVSLGDCGSHCRGAVFLDGGRFATPALEDAVECVARGYDGFYFGRFDVRAPSAPAFARGEFTIIELNGVTSEATHIYDPRLGLLDAYRVLFQQWAIAFEIGVENADRGAPVSSALDLLRMFRRYRIESRGQATASLPG